MSEMPREIYAWAGLIEGGSWDETPCPCGNHPEMTKYTRSDIHEADVKRLQDEIAELKKRMSGNL